MTRNRASWSGGSWRQKMRLLRSYNQVDHSKTRRTPAAIERTRLGRIMARASYPGWTFCVGDEARANPNCFVAFRSDPARPTRIQMLGPWPLPEDAGEEEVEAAARAAVAEFNPPDRLDRFYFRRGK